MTNDKATSALEFVVEENFDINDRPRSAETPSSVKSGWGNAMTPKKGFASEFKTTEKNQVVRFIDPNDGHPLMSYQSHFLSSKSVGKKSYVCLEENCPLCLMDRSIPGRNPENKVVWSLINFSVDPFERQLLIASVSLYKLLHKLAYSEVGPLDSKYWAISKSGARQTTTFHVTPIKARDLEEDWGINEAAAQAMTAITEPFDKSVIYTHSYEELAQIAADLS